MHAWADNDLEIIGNVLEVIGNDLEVIDNDLRRKSCSIVEVIMEEYVTSQEKCFFANRQKIWISGICITSRNKVIIKLYR